MAATAQQKLEHQNSGLPEKLIVRGFISGIAIAAILLVVVLFLVGGPLRSLITNIDSESTVLANSNLIRMKMCLLATGVISGIALIFLSLPLFLVGFNSIMKIESDKYGMKMFGVTPGVIALLSGAILIGFCCSQQFQIIEQWPSRPEDGNGEANDGSDPTSGIGSRKTLFTGEVSGTLKSLAEHMVNANPKEGIDLWTAEQRGKHFARVAYYLQTFSYELSQALQKEKITPEELERYARVFSVMARDLNMGKTPKDVSESMIKEVDGKYEIQLPSKSESQ
ncbi:hypothetical protein GYB59_02820 [bacterium]|nr:hypothetical protein [bacterium]